MRIKFNHHLFLPLLLLLFAAVSAKGATQIKAQITAQETTERIKAENVRTGAEQTELYLTQLWNKKVGIVANHTALVGSTHLVDMLIDLGIDIRMVFAPEHGFRGEADAGAHIKSYRDEKTGVEVVSIYGSNKKPDPKLIATLDIVLFDIQDVGLRYYTYLSSMHYAMESCAEAGVPFMVLDRPNPNGMYVDGPILEPKHRSFVGMHPIPTVHGMTLGELAQMINGKGWLKGGVKCELTVIPCADYTRQTRYQLPVKPSPNLPNMRSIYLYPSLCFMEGTQVSIGRGTEFPFQLYGHPKMKQGQFSFTPRTTAGATNPPQKDKLCWGVDLRHNPTDEKLIERGVDLSYTVAAYREVGGGKSFFLPIFKLLTGVDYVQQMIIDGYSAAEIEAMWRDDVEKFKVERKPYLIYDED